jgi:hypothetical protein
MKQRRGSVENVAETLMMALAASGESQENIAKVTGLPDGLFSNQKSHFG